MDGFDRSENLPPLQLVLNGCSVKEDSCRRVTEWLLRHGEIVDEVEVVTGLGFSALHNSVVECDEAEVAFLLSKKADPNVVAVGKKFDGQTPLAVLSQLRECAASQSIASALKQAGAREPTSEVD